jgi:hypothetical protein
LTNRPLEGDTVVTSPAASTVGFFLTGVRMVPVALYVDGFNLYYGKLKPNPLLKWLDLETLGRTLAPGKQLVKVRYFTATISGKLDPGAPLRQQTYLRALRSLPLVQVHFGHFETREKDRALVNPAPGQPKMVHIYNPEEKGSDVNLATWLLLDGVDGVYEEAIVVSNDSDLEEPIRQASQRFGPVHVVSPYTLVKWAPYTHSYVLEKAAASYRSLTVGEVAGSQFPNAVTLPTGKVVTRPTSWA